MDGTVNPFSVIPGFYVFKDRPLGFLEVLVGMQIDFFFLQYRMEGFFACIIIGIPFTAEGMEHSFAGQVILKDLARVLAAKIAVKDDPFGFFCIQTGIFYSLCCQLCRHGGAVGITNHLTAALIHHGSQIRPAFF